MSIRKITASNFKSFRHFAVELSRLNVLIGANASGKSNFVELLRFLRDVAKHGLNYAISMQGGVEYLMNVGLGSAEDLSLKVVYDPNLSLMREIDGKLVGLKTRQAVYQFTLRFGDGPGQFDVSKDRLQLNCDFFGQKRKTKEASVDWEESLGKGRISLSNVRGKLKLVLNVPDAVPIKREHLLPPFWREDIPAKTLLLENPVFIPMRPWERFFDEISTYDFDPKLPKKAVPITGKGELEEDGSNLAVILRNIIADKEKKRKFSNLIKDLLAFVDDLEVERLADKSVLLKLRETYADGLYLPASLISDGTINVAALIIAIYFEDKPLIVIEEPERNIHPFLISKVVGMLKDASERKQIIVTTHNPEVVKHVDRRQLLLVSRDKDGYSAVSRPARSADVKAFLKNEIGIEELYVDNLLGR